MNYTIREHADTLQVIGDGGLLSASLIEWTSSRARFVIGRDLVEGERFYWLNKIFNHSEKRGEGTKLLRFVVDMSEERNASIGFIASPDLPSGADLSYLPLMEEGLTNWYKRHGFREADSKCPVLIYIPEALREKYVL